MVLHSCVYSADMEKSDDIWAFTGQTGDRLDDTEHECGLCEKCTGAKSGCCDSAASKADADADSDHAEAAAVPADEASVTPDYTMPVPPSFVDYDIVDICRSWKDVCRVVRVPRKTRDTRAKAFHMVKHALLLKHTTELRIDVEYHAGVF